MQDGPTSFAHRVATRRSNLIPNNTQIHMCPPRSTRQALRLAQPTMHDETDKDPPVWITPPTPITLTLHLIPDTVRKKRTHMEATTMKA